MIMKEIVERMQENGNLDYGLELPERLIVSYLGVRRVENDDPWNYLGPYLDLKEEIESLGYMCTQRGCERGGMRILEVEEMAPRAQKIREGMLGKHKRVIKSLTSADISQLDNEQKRSHNSVAQRFVLSLQSIKSVLASI